MTRVYGVGAGRGAAKVGGSGTIASSGGPRFAVSTPAAPPEGPARTTAAAPVVLSGMLAMQEAESAVQRDRDSRRHGEQTLQALADLQLALLGEGAGEVALHRLAALGTQAPRAADPALDAAVRAVRLRARIEIQRRVPPPRAEPSIADP